MISQDKMAFSGRTSGGEVVDLDADSRRTEWHQLWVSLTRWHWSSLAVVPASESDWPMRISRALARVGSIHVHTPVQLIDVAHIAAGEVGQANEQIEGSKASHSTVVACPHPVSNELAIPVILRADAVLLAVVLGESSFKSTQQVMELFGSRIIGSVVVPAE